MVVVTELLQRCHTRGVWQQTLDTEVFLQGSVTALTAPASCCDHLNLIKDIDIDSGATLSLDGYRNFFKRYDSLKQIQYDRKLITKQ